MDTLTTITARRRETWGEAWLREHDPAYTPARAPRLAPAAVPVDSIVDAITVPVTAAAQSGDGDLAAVHAGGRLTPALLRKPRIDRGTHRAMPLIEQWGARRGNGKDGVLRRALDHEYAARLAGQAVFQGLGFDTANGGAR